MRVIPHFHWDGLRRYPTHAAEQWGLGGGGVRSCCFSARTWLSSVIMARNFSASCSAIAFSQSSRQRSWISTCIVERVSCTAERTIGKAPTSVRRAKYLFSGGGVATLAPAYPDRLCFCSSPSPTSLVTVI